MKGLYLANAPMTEQAAKLGLTSEITENCRVVYEKDKSGEGYVFHSLWHPEGDYGEEHIIMPVGSTYAGISNEYAKGTTFANVSLSTSDPKCPGPDPKHPEVVSNWMKLMRQAFEYCGESYDLDSCCAERNVIYNSNNDSIVSGFQCTKNGMGIMQGGHVLFNTKTAGTLAAGSNVYILPICTAHNVYRGLGEAGTGYYMTLDRNMKALMLKGYMQPPQV